MTSAPNSRRLHTGRTGCSDLGDACKVVVSIWRRITSPATPNLRPRSSNLLRLHEIRVTECRRAETRPAPGTPRQRARLRLPIGCQRAEDSGPRFGSVQVIAECPCEQEPLARVPARCRYAGRSVRRHQPVNTRRRRLLFAVTQRQTASHVEFESPIASSELAACASGQLVTPRPRRACGTGRQLFVATGSSHYRSRRRQGFRRFDSTTDLLPSATLRQRSPTRLHGSTDPLFPRN